MMYLGQRNELVDAALAVLAQGDRSPLRYDADATLAEPAKWLAQVVGNQGRSSFVKLRQSKIYFADGQRETGGDSRWLGHTRVDGMAKPQSAGGAVRAGRATLSHPPTPRLRRDRARQHPPASGKRRPKLIRVDPT